MGGPTPRTAVAAQQDIRLRLDLLERRLATGVVPSRLGPVLARVRDGNDAVPTGTFWLLQGGSTLNSPDTAQHWAVETFALDSGSYYQRASRIGATAIYADVWVRRFSATWSAWTPLSLSLRGFTPTVGAGVTLGNGTLTGVYELSDGVCSGRISFTLGSTSAITGDIRYNLAPIGVAVNMGNRYATNGARIIDATDSAQYDAQVIVNTQGIYVRPRVLPSGTAVQLGTMSATVPIPWAAGDVIETTFSYPTI